MPKDYNLFWSIIKLIIALPIVILLAYISLRLTNKYLYNNNKGKNIQVLERIPINNKASICLIKIGQEYIVMGISESNFYKIKTLDLADLDQFTEKINQGVEIDFIKRLNKLKKRKFEE